MVEREPQPPLPVFTAPHHRRATIEALVEVLPSPALRPAELAPLLMQVAERMGQLLEGVGADLPAEVTVEDVAVASPRHVPAFPVAFGGRLCEDPLAVEEVLEELRTRTPLDGLLYDAAGRAFACRIRAAFFREPGHDRSVRNVLSLDD